MSFRHRAGKTAESATAEPVKAISTAADALLSSDHEPSQEETRRYRLSSSGSAGRSSTRSSISRPRAPARRRSVSTEPVRWRVSICDM